MYYRFAENLPAAFVELFRTCQIKGKDAKKVIELQNAINDKQHAPYYLIDDKLAKFALETIDQISVPARMAVIIVDIQIALTNPAKTIPAGAAKTDKTQPIVPKPPITPK